MITTTGIRLKGVTFNNPALLKVVDYKSIIANNASCVGAFRFDDPNLLEVNGLGGITKIKNWGDAVTYLGFDSGANHARVERSEITGSDVARFTGNIRYLLGGAVWNAAADHSILVIMKPDSITSEYHIAGNWSSSVSQRCMVTTRPVGGIPKLAHYHGNSAPVCDIAVGKFLGGIASYDASTVTAKVQELNGGSGAQASAEAITTALPFGLSDINLPFLGQIDFVALFSTDVTKDAALLTQIKAYMKMRMGQ